MPPYTALGGFYPRSVHREGDRFLSYRYIVRRIDVRPWFGLGILLLVLGALPAQLQAQVDQNQSQSGFELEQNYPNPFNPETRIPFRLGESLFMDGRPATVTIRIYNVLRQLVASPTALGHTQGEGLPIEDLEFDAPGRFEAYWDGTDRSGTQVASGVYFVQLVVNGQAQVRKMFVTK